MLGMIYLHPEIQFLQQTLKEKEKLISEKDAQIQFLLEMLALARLNNYAARSEKKVLPDGDIFNEASAPAEAEPLPPNARKKPERKPLPPLIPRVDITYDLPEDEKKCQCGETLTPISIVVKEQLDVVPEIIRVLRHKRKKYACKFCNAVVKMADMPRQPIPKSIVSPGLLAHIALSKFCDHLPLYRQAAIFERNGIGLSRSVLSQWMRTAGQLIQPIINLMQEKVNSYDISYADETRVQVLKEKNKAAESHSYMWVFGGGSTEEFTWIFKYNPTRSGCVASDFFHDFKGYLHVDAYGGYNHLGKSETSTVTLVKCMAHVRRKFTDVIKLAPAKKGVAHEVVQRIGKLYAIEKRLKARSACVEEIQAVRATESRPLLEALKAYIEERRPHVLPNSALSKAIAYFCNHWDGLVQYLSDGRLEIDNNRTERAIKPFATGRKGWLFYDTPAGAEAAANIYSVIETCKFHHINPYEYLRFVFGEINNCSSVEDYEKLLPYQFQGAVFTEDIIAPA